MSTTTVCHMPSQLCEKWDAFLDAYSVYLKNPTLPNGASLHLAGVALETKDPAFSVGDFEKELGWEVAMTDHQA